MAIKVDPTSAPAAASAPGRGPLYKVGVVKNGETAACHKTPIAFAEGDLRP